VTKRSDELTAGDLLADGEVAWVLRTLGCAHIVVAVRPWQRERRVDPGYEIAGTFPAVPSRRLG